jgi:hypothetical protein
MRRFRNPGAYRLNRLGGLMKVSKTVTVFTAVMAATAAVLLPVTFLSAGASTTVCGSSCTSPYNESDGTSEVLTVSGSSVVMATASTTNSAQDWEPEYEDNVSEAVTAGIIPAKAGFLEENASLYEFQYAPDGVPSDKCLADNSSNAMVDGLDALYYVPTLTVGLSQCGTTAATLWAADFNTQAAGGYDDLINMGYETSYTFLAPNTQALPLTPQFAEPAVLTVNSSGNLVLAPLSELGGAVSQTQLWGDYLSPAQAELKKKAKSS